MTLLAGFGVVLQYYSGSEEVVVGTDVAGRNQRETEELIGFFVNQLALRVDMRGNPRFEELLGRVRGVCLGAYGHQEVPFEKVVEAVRPERGASHAPLFQVKLVLQNTPSTELTLPGLTLSAIPVDNRTAKFDLLLNIAESKSGLNGSLEYNTDLFTPDWIVQFMETLKLVLHEVAKDRTMTVSALFDSVRDAELQMLIAREEKLKASRHDSLKQIRRRVMKA